VTKYVLRRILHAIPVVLGALTLLWIFIYLLPGDPIAVLSGTSGKKIPEEVRINIARRYGLDQPVWRQYLDYLGRVIRFDLGESTSENRAVSSVIGRRFAQSARLAIWAMVVETLFGIGFGVFAARKKGRFADKLVLIVTVIIGAIPVFVMGFFLFQALGVFPFQRQWPQWTRFQLGIGPDTWFLGIFPRGHQWKFLILPCFTLAGVTTAANVRLMRASMLEAAGADYIRTARSKGLTRRKIVYKHALRNAAIPSVTALGLDFGVLLGGAILTETVYNWPGIGSAAAAAVDKRDTPLVMGIAIVIVLVYQVISLLIDISYGAIDPRIRLDRSND
jgi:ABC-type dipeptide/oligopeptide/nickel transport system permease component